MNKSESLPAREAQHKANAEHCLAEAQRVLRELALERQRAERRHNGRVGILKEVQSILRGA